MDGWVCDVCHLLIFCEAQIGLIQFLRRLLPVCSTERARCRVKRRLPPYPNQSYYETRTRMEVSSQVISHLPALRNALSIGRGGAILAAASVATDAALALSGGAVQSPAKSPAKLHAKAATKSPSKEPSKVLGFSVTPQGKSVLCMALAMACHYLGYSLARPVSIALFTSASTGYKGSAAAFPFAMAFVSPAALLLLVGYGRVLERFGPRGALMQSTAFCSLIVTLSAIAIEGFLRTGLMVGSIPAVKLITGPLFIFREAYVQLLTSQYWSFMASVMTPNESAKWFGPIAGLTSIASAVAGVAVSPLVERIGLSGALMGTGLMLMLSLMGASAAYEIADQNGFTPSDTSKRRSTGKSKSSAAAAANKSDIHKAGVLKKATHLFARVPVLWSLFLEILASQGLATVLNVCFVARLGTAIPDDSERAGYVGIFFALINVVTMVLQFGILPPLMTMIEPKDLWRAIPVVSILFTGLQALQKNPSLYTVSASLAAMKISEYSVRRMLDEMVYVPLDFESRFLGKEVIGVFGYRLGKSIMSLALSGVTLLTGDNFGLQELSILSNGVALVWMRTAWRLSNYVPTRQEAEDEYVVSRNIQKTKK
jgi:ATP/ADP translocase